MQESTRPTVLTNLALPRRIVPGAGVRSRARLGLSRRLVRARSRLGISGGGARRVTFGGPDGRRAERVLARDAPGAEFFTSKPATITGRKSPGTEAESASPRGRDLRSGARHQRAAAEQLAIAQSCDQRGNNPPTQRGLLLTLTPHPNHTPQLNPFGAEIRPDRPTRATNGVSRRLHPTNQRSTTRTPARPRSGDVARFALPSQTLDSINIFTAPRPRPPSAPALRRPSPPRRLASRSAASSSRSSATSLGISAPTSPHSASIRATYCAARSATEHASHLGSEVSLSSEHAATNDRSDASPSPGVGVGVGGPLLERARVRASQRLREQRRAVRRGSAPELGLVRLERVAHVREAEPAGRDAVPRGPPALRVRREPRRRVVPRLLRVARRLREQSRERIRGALARVRSRRRAAHEASASARAERSRSSAASFAARRVSASAAFSNSAARLRF